MKRGNVCRCGVNGGHSVSDYHERLTRLHLGIELEAGGGCSLNLPQG